MTFRDFFFFNPSSFLPSCHHQSLLPSFPRVFVSPYSPLLRLHAQGGGSRAGGRRQRVQPSVQGAALQGGADGAQDLRQHPAGISEPRLLSLLYWLVGAEIHAKLL